MDKHSDKPIETVEQKLLELRDGNNIEANALTSMVDLAQQLVKSNIDKKETKSPMFHILTPVRPPVRSIVKDENVIDYIEPLVETYVLEKMSRKWTKEKEMALASGQSEVAQAFSKCSKDLCKLIQETRQASGEIGLSKQPPTRRGSNAQKQHEEKCSSKETSSKGKGVKASRKASKKGGQGSSEAVQGV